MDNFEISYAVASMWLDVFMNSSTTSDVERFHELSNLIPIELNLIAMAGRNRDMLLREFLEIVKVPKSTLTSVVNRLEKKGYLKRVINQRDMGAKILQGLDREEQQQLLNLLKKITVHITAETSAERNKPC